MSHLHKVSKQTVKHRHILLKYAASIRTSSNPDIFMQQINEMRCFIWRTKVSSLLLVTRPVCRWQQLLLSS